jgi:ATP-binding cassette, subfamily B, bacterial CvaB/MchF/RaxB
MSTFRFFERTRRTPIILQSEAAECALACLAMVMSYHGQSVGLRELRAKHSISLKGINAARLLEIAAQCGLDARPLRAEIAALGRLKRPCVLHWDCSHFVVLVEFDERRQVAVIHDPAKGRVSLTLDEVSGYFTGIAVELEPAASFTLAPPAPRVRLRDLVGVVQGLGSALAQIGIFGLLAQALMLVSPLFMQWIVDRVIVSHDYPLLVTLAVGFALLLLFEVAVSFVRGWATANLTVSVALQWTGSLFGHLLRLPIEFFGRRILGDILTRLQSTRVIQLTLSRHFVDVILDVLICILALVMMLMYSPTLALVSLASAVLYLVLRATTYPVIRNLLEEQMNLIGRQQSHLVESIRGIESLKLAGKEGLRSSMQSALLGNIANRDFSLARLQLWFASANQLLFGIERIAVVAIGASFVMSATLTVGMLLAYVAYKDQFTSRIASVIDRWMELRNLRVHTERLADIALTPPEEVDGRSQDAVAHSAVLELDVSYTYAPSEPSVLDGCRLVVHPGESIAITGASGCGKTTLLKVALGLYPPTSGCVRVSGHDVRDIGLRTYRAMVSAVMQDDPLFAGSIEENIAFFDATPDHERIIQAAKTACIHDDISRMPMGYRTLVGDMGTTLSGGQKQRVVLARALYRNPRILFMDEATSHLDLPTERQVNKNLDALGITRVVVAHRPQTIQAAHRVYRLTAGKLVLAAGLDQVTA